MSSGLLFGTNSIFAKIDTFTSFGLDRKLDDMLGLTPPETKGPRLSDLTVQTSTFGTHIPRLYGTISVMGNLLWLENGQLKESVRKKKKGGKGGGGASEPTTTYSYSATFHLALCEGPIAGIRRMWCGDKLLYNAGSGDLETIIASNKAATGWKLYLGTNSQLPDSRYEANVGAGNATAHRGLAYIAFYDFQLADYSNTLQGSQFKVEVVKGGEDTVSILLDVAPTVQTAFGPESGGAFRGDFTGLRFLTDRYLGAAKVGDIRLGQQVYVDDEIDSSGGNPLELVRSAVSYDGDVWYVDQIDDLFDSTRVTRQSDGLSFNIYKRADVQFIRMISDTECVCLWTSSATPGGLTSVGRMSLAVSPSFGVVLESLSPPADHRISSSGDQVHAYRIASTALTVKLYDDTFAETNSYTVSIPPEQFPNVNLYHSYGAGSPVNSCMLDGVLYLLVNNPSTGANRVLAVKDGAVVGNFAFSVTSTSAVYPHAFYMASPTQGYFISSRAVQFSRYIAGIEPLAGIIADELSLAGVIGPADIDASSISSGVRGYRVSGGSIRSALEPLQAAFPFDVRAHGYKLQFLPRGQASIATIQWEELGAADGNKPAEMLPQSIEMDTQLPARTTVKYLDAAREYAISEQYSERLNTEAINRVDRELALVMTADEAAGAAEVLQFLPWLERNDLSFTLPAPYRYLEAGDVVTIAMPNTTHELRLTEPNETPDGRLECKAKPSRAALYAPAALGVEGVPSAGTIGLAGDSLFVPLDIPVIDEALQDAPGFVGVMTGDTPGWPGGVAVRSADSGQTWSDLQAFTGKATIGRARSTLPASSCALIDSRSITVDMISGAPESITRDQLLAGANYAAYGVDGRWEIVRFQGATLQVDGSYLLSGFMRGEKGTEWASGLHAAGDYFVLLDDPDNAFIGSPVESILAPRTYRGITSGGALDDAVDVPFTYRGVNLECLSPVYAKGVRDGSSNLAVTFTRRSRLSSSWWATGVAAPVGEASEAYEIDVMSGSTVKRTITASSPSFAYSAANQTTDFGGAQASITLRIYQLSAVVGRGYPLEVTL